MKTIILLLLLLSMNQQINIVGKYKDHFGSQIVLNSDSTFHWSYLMDGVYFWAKGNWELNYDTLYLNPIPIYDTLRISGFKDTLVKAFNEIPRLRIEDYFDSLIWANDFLCPQQDVERKLYYKDNKLIKFDKEGNLITKKETHPLYRTKSLYDPWFEKVSK